MMTMTRGWEFPWRSGGVALLRRELYPTPHRWSYCGIAYGADTQVRNFKSLGHKVNQAYQYAAVVFLGSGFVSRMCEPVRIDLDAGGDLIEPALPNAAVAVTAVAIAGGKFRIVWEYNAYGHGGYPKDWQVFEGADAGSVDYNTPLTDSVTGLSAVPYKGTGRIFTFTTAAYGAGTVHVFGVRGRNANDVAEKNTFVTVAKKTRATAPVAAPAPQRAHVLPVSRVGG